MLAKLRCCGIAVLLAAIMPHLLKAQELAGSKNGATNSTQPRNLLVRRYVEGETLTYLMKGKNEGWNYQIQGTGVVKKDPTGAFFEEFQWSNLVSNRGDVLSASGTAFRHELTLDLHHRFVFPNLAQAPPVLIGPITDLLTFYSDAMLAEAQANFSKPGDHVYIKWPGGPNSWADGTYVLIGEDSIDFDVTLSKIDEAEKTATLKVRHVPPAQPTIKIPVEWMRMPVMDSQNNWVEVQNRQGKYLAAIGRETFDVEMKLSLVNGKILWGKLDNIVNQVQRECSDKTLQNCSDPTRHQIHRDIEITLEQ